MNTETFLNKILVLLDSTEEIEYTLLEKNKLLDFIVLTNKKIIYTNLDLFEKNVFHFFDIKNNNTQNIVRLKKMLQSDDFEINTIISKYFNLSTDEIESVS
ncbi:hypothetical protein GCM10022389_27840 [Flavobacterium cheonanense]|uniref:Uncharacterized protein n=1 Tax=Flavobacterium cheonanense TaxID=706183 RepID=A0ABP7W4H3_9FLAO